MDEGLGLGAALGFAEGRGLGWLGTTEGAEVGAREGLGEGAKEGRYEGSGVGGTVGRLREGVRPRDGKEREANKDENQS